MTERRTIPPILAGVEHFFIKPEDISDYSRGRLLKKMWEILDTLCPAGSATEVTLRVPSDRLVELGLVSERRAGEITGRKVRKKQEAQTDEPSNIVRFCRTSPEVFAIVKTYISEEQERPVRIDKVVEEKMLLERDEKGFGFSVWKREDNLHLHTLGQRWIQANPSGKSELQEVKQNFRDLNRTLALIAEGLVPGCLGSKSF